MNSTDELTAKLEEEEEKNSELRAHLAAANAKILVCIHGVLATIMLRNSNNNNNNNDHNYTFKTYFSYIYSFLPLSKK